MQNRIKAIVTRVEGMPSYSYWFKDQDDNAYYAHLGDLAKNSEKLLHGLNYATEHLKEGDKVEFQ